MADVVSRVKASAISATTSAFERRRAGAPAVARTPSESTAFGAVPVVSVSEDGTARVWSLATGELVRTLSGHAGGVQGVAVTADGQACVSAGGDDATLWLWDVDARRVVKALAEPASPRSAWIPRAV